MRTHDIIIVAFKEFDNLGVGYLASVLSEKGYQPLIIDFRDGREKIIKNIRENNPLVVGFSVIFQFYIYEFHELILALRESGIKCHFSAGGQYASMRYADLFTLIPSIDSIVRFEGEYTFLELADRIRTGSNWRDIKGLAFMENGEIIINPPRPPELELDRFPFPVRSPLEEYALFKKFSTIIAGRGCVNNCSFCNNTEYLRQSSFPIKRIRNPSKVAEEIAFLHHNNDCSVFLFEDDDFPLNTKTEPDWTDRFCKELKRRNLVRKIIWKINCRPDEVEMTSFTKMKDHGLFLVFLGIDDGTDSGLNRLKKQMSVVETLRGINILKQLEIGINYGFMLFQPDSSFETVNQNLDFLRRICGDGYTPVAFHKLLPFFDTKVEKQLKESGRLNGRPGFFDYDFLNKSLDHYYNFYNSSFYEWLYDPDGLLNVSKWARNYLLLFAHLYKMDSEVRPIGTEVQNIVAQSNMFLLDTMAELSGIFETGKYDSGNYIGLIEYKKNIKVKHDIFKEKLGNLVKRVNCIAEYQKVKKMIRN